MKSRVPYLGALLLLGIGWGSTQPLGKIATSSGHGHFLLIFWQQIIGTAVLGTILVLRRKPFALTLPVLQFSCVIAVVGTLIPNSTFYIAVAHLPAGIMSIIISTIPLVAFPMALALGMDRFSIRRLAGLLFGLAGVALIALPKASLPDPGMAQWLPVALIGPLCYALEGNIVAKWGTAGLDPIQAMFAAIFVGAIFALPLAIVSGQWVAPSLPMGKAEFALITSSALNALLYAGYIGLALRAGAVFASQTSYIVTGSGLLWAMWLLGEGFSHWVWAAVAVMFVGLFLVSPRDGATQNP